MHDDRRTAISPPTSLGDRGHQNSDQSLVSIQYARKLQRITASIETFFQCQIDRLENSLAACQSNVERADEIQQTVASFALQKQTWEKERQAESERLDRACVQLIEGWKQLEESRREWLTRKSTLNEQQSAHLTNSTEDSPLSLLESNPSGERPVQARSPGLNSLELETLRMAMNKHRNGKC